MNVRKKLPRAVEKFGKLCDTVREKYEPRFLRHLLSALPFIVFAILSIAASSSRQIIPKSCRKKCKAIKSGKTDASGAAKTAGRAGRTVKGFNKA